MIFREWHEFVTYSLDPNRVRTRAERLDTRRAFRRTPGGEYPHDYTPSSSRGAVIDLNMIVRDGDCFECMEVDDFGGVLIWTQRKVWLLARNHPNGIEKLFYVPRHPSQKAEPETL